MNEKKIHKFELAGLGKAPFKLVGLAQVPSASLCEHNPSAYNAALAMLPKGYGCGTCNYCGTAIMNCYLINSADGNKFAVGCECVRKTGDAGLVNKQRALKAQADREKKRLERQERYEAELQEQRDRNGGKTDNELIDEKHQAEIQVQWEKSRCRAALMGELASDLRDGKGGFKDSIARSMDEGEIPLGRGWDLVCEILAKQEGRKGSAAYDKAYEQVERQLDSAAKIK